MTISCALAALQQEKEPLIAVMDVFIKEPLLEWVKWATRVPHAQKSAPFALVTHLAAARDSNWFPKQKVAFARRKLELSNPAHVMAAELRLSVAAVNGKGTYFDSMLVRRRLVLRADVVG